MYKIKKGHLINEIMGVPQQLEPWTNSFSEIIIDLIKKEVDKGWPYSGEVIYINDDGEEITDIAYKTESINISGKEFMRLLAKNNGFSNEKELLKSKIFKDFPLWRPEIRVEVKSIPKELYEKERTTVQADFGMEMQQELSTLAGQKVLPKSKFGFDVLTGLKDGGDFGDKLVGELKSTISHELLHAYQKYKQLQSGGKSHYGRETALNALSQNPTLTDIEINWWKSFLHLIYLHLSFEINARVTQLYHEMLNKGVKTKEDFLKELKKSQVWSEMKNLEEFNAKEYIETFKIPKLDSLNSITENPLLYLSKLQKLKNIKDRGLDVLDKNQTLKDLINLWDDVLQIGNEHVKNAIGIDFDMLPVPESARENPFLFFKFFEKRFHKKAKKWKKKLYRLASLLVKE